MAQEKELTLDSAEEQASGGGGKSKLYIILIVLVILLGGGAAAAYFLLAGDTNGSEEKVEETAVVEPSQYLKITPAFIVNYRVDNRQRYLQVEMTLVTRDGSKLALFKNHMPFIQSDINSWLNAQAFEELRDPETRESLRQALVENLQLKLEEETGEESGLEDVLFTSFVMQ